MALDSEINVLESKKSKKRQSKRGKYPYTSKTYYICRQMQNDTGMIFIV